VQAGDRALIILNPAAGRGRAAKRKPQLERVLQEAGLAYDLLQTEKTRQAVEFASIGRRDGYAVIVAAGGDGTINEIINGMAMATPAGGLVGPIAVIPLGSGNDFAFALNSHRDLRSAVQAIQTGRTRRLDLGLATLQGPTGTVHRYFHNSLGFGLEASVTQESNRIQRLSGGALYLAAAFRALKAYDTPHSVIEWLEEPGENERIEQRITLVSVGNAKRTGGAFYLTPDAEVDDGLFDVAVAGALSRRQVLTLLPKALMGKHIGHASVRMLRCREIRARSDAPLPVHMDGEVMMADAVEVTAVIEAGRLEILV
jgi:diacylglycerol kinase (ATP)